MKGSVSFSAEEESAIRERMRGVQKQAKRNSDPLGLTSSGKARRAAQAARDAFVRSGGLSHLRQGKSPLAEPLYEVALDLHFLWLAAKGDVGSIDWMQERVDTSTRNRDVIGGALDADRELRRLISGSGMGRQEAAAVLAICCEGMTVTAFAFELETDETAKANGGCSRATIDRARWLLTSGLKEVLRATEQRGDSVVGPVSCRVLAWLDSDARSTESTTTFGNRSDLPLRRAAAKGA